MRHVFAGPTKGEPEHVNDEWVGEVGEVIKDDVKDGALDPEQVCEGHPLEMEW